MNITFTKLPISAVKASILDLIALSPLRGNIKVSQKFVFAMGDLPRPSLTISKVIWSVA